MEKFVQDVNIEAPNDGDERKLFIVDNCLDLAPKKKLRQRDVTVPPPESSTDNPNTKPVIDNPNENKAQSLSLPVCKDSTETPSNIRPFLVALE